MDILTGHAKPTCSSEWLLLENRTGRHYGFYWGAKPTLAPVIETVPPPNHDNNW